MHAEVFKFKIFERLYAEDQYVWPIMPDIHVKQ